MRKATAGGLCLPAHRRGPTTRRAYPAAPGRGALGPRPSVAPRSCPASQAPDRTGYANGPNYALLEAQGVTAWIPVFGHYKPEIAGFVYDRAADQYTCPAGKPLPFQKYATNQDGGWHKLYSAAYRDCQQCPLKTTCIPNAQRKKLTKTIYDAAYRRAWHRQQTRRGQRLRRVRQSTVEPVFGNLIHHYGLRRMNVRDLPGAHKTMLLTAITFNLKKLLRYRRQFHQSAVIALPRPLPAPDTRFCLRSRWAKRQNPPLRK